MFPESNAHTPQFQGPGHLTIIKSSHNFVVTEMKGNARYITTRFSWNFQQSDWKREHGRWIRVPVRDWFVNNKVKNEFRFHINAFDKFIVHLAEHGFLESNYTIITNPRKPAKNFVIDIRPEYQPRLNQPKDIDFLVSHLGQCPSLLLQTQTGGGKSFISLKASAKFGKRMVYVVKPQYIKKWLDDLEKHCFIPRDRIFVVQGGEALEDVINLATNNMLDVDVILISNRTLQAWYRDYETIHGYRGYDCEPGDFFEHIGAGLRLMDEVHQDFHLMFKVDLYTNVDQAISMSAEIEGDNRFENQMTKVAYPEECRTERHEFNKYVDTKVLTYNFKMPQRLKYQVNRNYNHIKLEQSIMRHIPTFQNYVKMILDTADDTHRDGWKPGDKLIIFVASIEMATQLTKAAKKRWVGKDVRRYVEKDPFENLMQGDVTITTLGSGGTGHDIPNLTTCILTPSVMATRSNIQGFGRLRDLKDRKKKFLYMACLDIPKQVEYDQAKRALLNGRTLTFSELHYPHLI